MLSVFSTIGRYSMKHNQQKTDPVNPSPGPQTRFLFTCSTQFNTTEERSLRTAEGAQQQQQQQSSVCGNFLSYTVRSVCLFPFISHALGVFIILLMKIFLLSLCRYLHYVKGNLMDWAEWEERCNMKLHCIGFTASTHYVMNLLTTKYIVVLLFVMLNISLWS